MRKCRDWQFPTVLTRFEYPAWQGTRGACSTMPDNSSTSTLPPTCARNHLVANRPLWDSTSVRLPRGKRRLPESSCSTSPTSVVRPNSIGRAPLERSHLQNEDLRGPSTPPMVMPETPGAVRNDDVTHVSCQSKIPLVSLSQHDGSLLSVLFQPYRMNARHASCSGASRYTISTIAYSDSCCHSSIPSSHRWWTAI